MNHFVNVIIYMMTCVKPFHFSVLLSPVRSYLHPHFPKYFLCSGWANRTPQKRITHRIRTTLEFHLCARIILGPGLLCRKSHIIRKSTALLVCNLIGVAVPHHWIPAAIPFCTLDLIAVLVVLQPPGDGVVGACVFVGGADDGGGRCGACCGADFKVGGDC